MRTLAILLLSTSAFAANWDSELVKARDTQDRAALQRSIANLQAAADRAPKDADAHYRAALANSYLGEIALELKDKGVAAKAAEEGTREAEKAIALQPKNAEYYRVLATLCGQAIPAVNILNAITYGKRAKDAITTAKELDPKSARVFQAEGVGNYYLPPNFGGGPELAIKDFQHAIDLDPKSSESYLWMGLALRKLHRNAEARQKLQKAVDLDPQRIWTKQQLEKTPPQ